MSFAVWGRRLAFWLCCLGLAPAASAQSQSGYSFGVLPQRSAVLTAQHWNPLLEYVQRKSGIPLVLRLARNATESDAAVGRGEYDFVYSNHIFQPRMAAANYQVILRPRTLPIAGQIAVPEGSSLQRLEDLQGREVGFPSVTAFVGYQVPMRVLEQRGIVVKPVFGGNQEGIMAQLKAGRVSAAAVNSELMAAFAARENFPYRILWESPPYHNIPIAAHPRVPAAAVEAVRQAFDAMPRDPEGRRALDSAARAIGQLPPYGFQVAGPEDYRSYTDFYRAAAGSGDK